MTGYIDLSSFRDVKNPRGLTLADTEEILREEGYDWNKVEGYTPYLRGRFVEHMGWCLLSGLGGWAVAAAARMALNGLFALAAAARDEAGGESEPEGDAILGTVAWTAIGSVAGIALIQNLERIDAVRRREVEERNSRREKIAALFRSSIDREMPLRGVEIEPLLEGTNRQILEKLKAKMNLLQLNDACNISRSKGAASRFDRFDYLFYHHARDPNLQNVIVWSEVSLSPEQIAELKRGAHPRLVS